MSLWDCQAYGLGLWGSRPLGACMRMCVCARVCVRLSDCMKMCTGVGKALLTA